MINQEAGGGQTESVDIKEYLSILLKRKWLILVCFLLSMAGTTAFLFTRQPVYRATARLLVSRAGNVMPAANLVHEDTREFYNTQFSIMRSQTMLARVQKRLKKTPEEMRELLRGYSVGGSDIMTISANSPSRDFAREFANTLADEYLRFRDEEKAKVTETALLSLTREINRLSQELKAANERYVNFIRDNERLGVSDMRKMARQQATQTLGAAATALAEAQTRKDLMESRPTVASALVVVTAEEEAAKRALADGSVLQPSVPTLTSGPDLLSLNLMPPEEKAAVESDELAPLLEQPRQPSALELPTFEGINPMAFLGLSTGRAERLFGLQDRQQSLENRLAQLLTLYREKHPAIIESHAELARLAKQIDAEVLSVRRQAAANLMLTQARYERAKDAFDQMNIEAFEDRSTEVELAAIQGDISRLRGLYSTLLNKLVSIDVTSSFDRLTISVLEPAIAGTNPIYPKKMKGMLMAAAVGIGLGLALAFFIEYIDDSIKLAEEVERDLQLPFLGMIPAAQWDPDDMSAHRLDRLKQQGGVAEAYRVVRSAILFSIPREKLRSMLLTSAVPREGKTTTCVNMAIGFSQIEDRILLVDADLRRGEVNKYFGFDREKGLADILLGEANPEDVIKHSDVPNLDVITSGSYPSNPAELLLGWRLKEFLDWAYKHYNRVIFDGPPVMGIADSAILGSAVDGVMLVIWAGRTSRRYVRVAKMTAVSRGAKIFGFMLNNLEPSRVGYYHYYPYYYSYYTRGYYYAHKEEPAAAPAAPTTPGAPAAKGTKPTPVTRAADTNDIDDVY